MSLCLNAEFALSVLARKKPRASGFCGAGEDVGSKRTNVVERLLCGPLRRNSTSYSFGITSGYGPRNLSPLKWIM